MKKIIFAMIAMMAVLLSGCQKASDLLSEPSPTPIVPTITYTPIATPEPEVPKTQISIRI
jgi:PBP1b-binding outer membrane lipoprotein LpoB